MKKTLLLSSLSLALLSACGGSDDNDNSGGPDPSQKNTLSLTALYVDACGNETPASSSAIIIHNSDYSTRQTVYAGSDGVIKFTTDNDNETFSLVMSGQQKVNGVTPIDVTTFVDHPVIDMGKNYYATYGDSNCECRTGDVRVNIPGRINDRVNDSRMYGAPHGAQDIYSGSVYYRDVTQCKDAATGQWPTMSVINSYTYPSEAYGAIFDSVTDGQLSVVDAEILGEPVSINSPLRSRQVSALINGQYHLNSFDAFGDGQVYAFSHDKIENHSVEAYEFEDFYPETGSAYVLDVSSLRTLNINQTIDLQPLDISVEEMASLMDLGGGVYDVSGDGGVDYVYTNLSALSGSQPLLSWSIFSPPSGYTVNLDNLNLDEFIDDAALETYVDSLRMSASVRDFGGINGYEDYMTRRPNRQAVDLNRPEYASRQTKIIQVSENNISYSKSAVSKFSQSNF